MQPTLSEGRANFSSVEWDTAPSSQHLCLLLQRSQITKLNCSWVWIKVYCMLIALPPIHKVQLACLSGIYSYSISLHNTVLQSMLCFEDAMGCQEPLCPYSLSAVTQGHQKKETAACKLSNSGLWNTIVQTGVAFRKHSQNSTALPLIMKMTTLYILLVTYCRGHCLKIQSSIERGVSEWVTPNNSLRVN